MNLFKKYRMYVLHSLWSSAGVCLLSDLFLAAFFMGIPYSGVLIPLKIFGLFYVAIISFLDVIQLKAAGLFKNWCDSREGVHAELEKVFGFLPDFDCPCEKVQPE